LFKYKHRGINVFSHQAFNRLKPPKKSGIAAMPLRYCCISNQAHSPIQPKTPTMRMNKVIYFLMVAFCLAAGFTEPLSAQELKPVLTKKAIKQKPFAMQASTMQKMQDTGMRKMPHYKINFRKVRKFKPPTSSTTTADSLEEERTAMTSTVVAKAGPKPTIWSNFLASAFDEFPYITPPDPNGDVSSSQVVVATNASIKVFPKRKVTDAPRTTKTGGSLKTATSEISILLDDFFAPVLPFGSFTSDPHVRYDRLSKRWFMTAIEVNPILEGNNLLLAVSGGEQLNENTTIFYYSFPMSDVLPVSAAAPYQPFLDYPTLGVDRNAVAIGGVNFFPGEFGVDSVNFIGLLIDKKRILAGQLYVYAMNLGKFDYANEKYAGMFVPQGVHNDDPSATKSHFAGITIEQDGLSLAAINFNAKGVPTKMAASIVPIEPFSFPRDVVALGSPMPIDALDTRLLAAAIRKNKITGKSSLWTAHAIGVSGTGGYVAQENFVAEARTASRWYEIGNIYSKPTLTQFGTLYDPSTITGRRANSYFNPSIAANGQGYAALAGTVTAYNEHLNVFVAGRHAEEGKGMLGERTRATNARALYALFPGSYSGRWGDYSQTVVDPDDDQTIWTFQEYANWDDNYGTRATQLKAPPPATPLPLGTLYNRADTTITIKGMTVDHSGFFDPGTDKGGPGYNRLSVKVTEGIIASNIKFNSPTEITCKLHIRNKPEGEYTVVITNPDGQIVTTRFTITAKTAMSRIAPKPLPVITTAMRVYPNPTPGDFRLQVQAAQTFTGRVILLDLAGKQLSEQRFSLVKGDNNISLSLNQYAAGSYVVVVYDAAGNMIGTQVVVKQ
jgi:hypothetical protein